MGEEMNVNKPSRSDEILGADEQMKIAQTIRTHFDSMAPKRNKKPNRSEGPVVSGEDDVVSPSIEIIPEQEKLQELRSQSLPVCLGEINSSPQEEFVETEYYSELNAIDKQHTTTGKGFIRVGGGGEDGFAIRQPDQTAAAAHIRSGFASNPATNEWMPNTEEEVASVSSKPNRSEGSA